MRAAYVTTYDSSDVHAWSGLGFHISRCLELAGVSVERIGPLERRTRAVTELRRVEAKLHGRTYPLDRDPDVADAYAAQVEAQLASTTCDLVFSPGTIPIAHLDADAPVAFWCDGTFAAMLRLYPDYRSLSSRAIRQGMELDNRALSRAAVAFYASEWAARSAVEDHGADPAKVEVMPFGANMPIWHDRTAVAQLISDRSPDGCRLLWVGVDWDRKGGARAVEIARLLNERGMSTELDVVGCAPPREVPPWVHVHGFVDKATESGAEHLRRLYAAAHVLVHPASAECFGVVFCEAAGHGVLSAASRVGGIPSAVREGITGELFDADAPADEYVDHIGGLLDDRDEYRARALRAFDEYERVLSWAVQAKRVGSRLAEVV